MRERAEAGFSLLELMVAVGILLAVLGATLWFFSKGQTVYSDERATLDMAQDLRTAFDRFTDEVRMAGAGLPGYHGVVSGSINMLLRNSARSKNGHKSSSGRDTIDPSARTAEETRGAGRGKIPARDTSTTSSGLPSACANIVPPWARLPAE